MFNFFKKPAFGLDISDYSVEIISLGGRISNPELLAMGRVILKPGVVKNGEILNKEELKKSLKNLIENPKFGKIKTRQFIFTLAESRVFLDIFETPKNLRKAERLEFIRSKVSQTFPYSLEELNYDFLIRDKDNTYEVFLVGASKAIVDDYLEIFELLKLRPLVIDIESEGLARSLITDNKKPTLIIDIGARTTNFGIFDQKGLRLSISNEIAGNKFTQSLIDGLKISKTEAEKIKKEVGLNPEIEEGKIFLILQRDIQIGMIWQIRKIEKYFQQKEGKKIEKIILAGGSSMLPFLKEYLADNLEREVEIGDPLVKINIEILKKKEYFEEALKVSPILYAPAIGSALRGLTKNPEKVGINLIGQIGAKKHLLKRKLSSISTILSKIKRSP